MIKSKGLAHVGVFVEDLERSKAFYKDILDFEQTWEFSAKEDDGAVAKAAFMKNGNLVLELIQAGHFTKRQDGVVDHIAILVEDIENAVVELKAKGIVFESKEIVHNMDASKNGSKWILFRGPDKEHLEISQVM